MVPTYIGDGYSSVAPSRFGYFGTALPRRATPIDQADAHLCLLDHVQIERAVAVGYSAGSASAIQLALRHPDRLYALILIAAHLPGLPTPRRVIHPIMRAAFRWQRMFWALKFSHAPNFQQAHWRYLRGGHRPQRRRRPSVRLLKAFSRSNRATAGHVRLPSVEPGRQYLCA